MSRPASRYLDRCCGIRYVLAAIVSVVCAAGGSSADERLQRPGDSSVAKADSVRPAATSATTEKASKEHIQQLIGDLGSSHYTARRAAANELRQIGSDAFDLLDAATESPDPEVAASAT